MAFEYQTRKQRYTYITCTAGKGGKVEKLKSRKLIFAVTCELCATVAASFGGITPEMWVDMTKWIFIGYVGGNALSKVGVNLGGIFKK